MSCGLPSHKITRMPGLSHPRAQGLCVSVDHREDNFASLSVKMIIIIIIHPKAGDPERGLWAWVTQPTSGWVPHCHNFAQSCPPLETATCHWRVCQGERRLNYSKQNVKSKEISPASWPVHQPEVVSNTGKSVIWCSLYLSPAKQSYIDFSCLHLYRQGKIFLLPFLLLIV